MKKTIIYTGIVKSFTQQPDFVRNTCTNVISLSIEKTQEEGQDPKPWDDTTPVDFDYTTNGETNSSLDTLIHQGDRIKIIVRIEKDWQGKNVHKVINLKNFTPHKNFRSL